MSSIQYPSYQRPVLRPPTARQRYSLEHALLSILLGLLFFVAIFFLFITSFEVWYGGRIYPGISVDGMDMSGLTVQQAADRIAAQVAYPNNGKILLRDGTHIWSATPAQLGLYFDPQTTAQKAFEIGRQGVFTDQLKDQYAIFSSGSSLQPVMILDERATYAYLTTLAGEVDKPSVEASIELKGTEVSVRQGQIGRSLDIPKTTALISMQMRTLHDSIINLSIEEKKPQVLDATQQATLARQMLSQPLTIALPKEDADQSGPWVIDPQTLASMLTFELVKTDKGQQYQMNLNTDQLRSYLTQIAPTLVRTSQNPLMHFNDDTHQLEVAQHAVIGRELDVEGSINAIQEKLRAGEHTISMSMKYTNPGVTDTSTGESLGIRELVHAETSYYYGSSAARVQNITTAASKFNGVLVAPGEVFSMATTLGDITLDNGYAEALIILGNQTIKGVGGGVCQVSTTLFRAAFFAGFPIVERHAHAYRVYYYEKVAGNRVDPKLAGLDATVFVPLVDFKFTNDTPNWLLMETEVNPANSSITWKFYSTPNGRSVTMDTTGTTNLTPPPAPVYHENPDLAKGKIKQVDWAAEGADVSVTRTVTQDGQVVIQDTFNTHYQAWPDMFEYGPGTDVPTQDANKPQG